MTQYPHDRFDDVPTYDDRKGTHRADPSLKAGSSGLVGISVAAALALVVGAFCFLVLPSLLPAGAPGAGSTSGAGASASATVEPEEPAEPAEPSGTETAGASAGASAEPSESAPAETADPSESPEPSETEPSETAPADTGDTSAPVEVYNASSIGGLAGQVSGGLTAGGFSVVGTGNWQGFPVQSSAVYYSQNVTTAQAVAAQLGLPLVQDARVPGIAVVLHADYSG